MFPVGPFTSLRRQRRNGKLRKSAGNPGKEKTLVGVDHAEKKRTGLLNWKKKGINKGAQLDGGREEYLGKRKFAEKEADRGLCKSLYGNAYDGAACLGFRRKGPQEEGYWLLLGPDLVSRPGKKPLNRGGVKTKETLPTTRRNAENNLETYKLGGWTTKSQHNSELRAGKWGRGYCEVKFKLIHGYPDRHWDTVYDGRDR